MSREEELRAAAGAEDGAIAVLADFYEQNGQPSRAALWRDPTRARQGLFSAPPDFLLMSNSDIDPRRNAMIWLLLNVIQETDNATITRRWLAALFGLSSSRLGQIGSGRDRLIRAAALIECRKPTMRATQRLLLAGAIRRPLVYVTARGVVERAPTTAQSSLGIVREPIPHEPRMIEHRQIELPPDTWPRTGTVGIMGPKRIRLPDRRRLSDPLL